MVEAQQQLMKVLNGQISRNLNKFNEINSTDEEKLAYLVNSKKIMKTYMDYQLQLQSEYNNQQFKDQGIRVIKTYNSIEIEKKYDKYHKQNDDKYEHKLETMAIELEAYKHQQEILANNEKQKKLRRDLLKRRQNFQNYNPENMVDSPERVIDKTWQNKVQFEQNRSLSPHFSKFDTMKYNKQIQTNTLKPNKNIENIDYKSKTPDIISKRLQKTSQIGKQELSMTPRQLQHQLYKKYNKQPLDFEQELFVKKYDDEDFNPELTMVLQEHFESPNFIQQFQEDQEKKQKNIFHQNIKDTKLAQVNENKGFLRPTKSLINKQLTDELEDVNEQQNEEQYGAWNKCAVYSKHAQTNQRVEIPRQQKLHKILNYTGNTMIVDDHISYADKETLVYKDRNVRRLKNNQINMQTQNMKIKSEINQLKNKSESPTKKNFRNLSPSNQTITFKETLTNYSPIKVYEKRSKTPQLNRTQKNQTHVKSKSPNKQQSSKELQKIQQLKLEQQLANIKFEEQDSGPSFSQQKSSKTKPQSSMSSFHVVNNIPKSTRQSKDDIANNANIKSSTNLRQIHSQKQQFDNQDLPQFNKQKSIHIIENNDKKSQVVLDNKQQQVFNDVKKSLVINDSKKSFENNKESQQGLNKSQTVIDLKNQSKKSLQIDQKDYQKSQLNQFQNNDKKSQIVVDNKQSQVFNDNKKSQVINDSRKSQLIENSKKSQQGLTKSQTVIDLKNQSKKSIQIDENDYQKSQFNQSRNQSTIVTQDQSSITKIIANIKNHQNNELIYKDKLFGIVQKYFIQFYDPIVQDYIEKDIQINRNFFDKLYLKIKDKNFKLNQNGIDQDLLLSKLIQNLKDRLKIKVSNDISNIQNDKKQLTDIEDVFVKITLSIILEEMEEELNSKSKKNKKSKNQKPNI